MNENGLNQNKYGSNPYEVPQNVQPQSPHAQNIPQPPQNGGYPVQYPAGQPQPSAYPQSGPYQASPYQTANFQPGGYHVPAELNASDKEEYFQMWKDFSWIPRPAVMWWGGLLAAVALSAPFSFSEGLYNLMSSIFSWTWLILCIVGTVAFKQGAAQVFARYPHLATSNKNLVQIRKVARLRVGYNYKDTFSMMWLRVTTLFSGIGKSNRSI